MNRAGQFLVDKLSWLLKPNSRAVVMGDLAELKLGSLRSVWELCGLIARQQASLWKNPQPWIALLGVGGLVGLQLTFIATRLIGRPDLYIRMYLTYGVIYQSGLSLTEEVTRGVFFPANAVFVYLSLATAAVMWSWTAGFTFASLAGETVLVTGSLLSLLWLGWNVFIAAFMLPYWIESLWFLPLLLIPWDLFLVPAFCGARRAFHRNDLPRRHAMLLLAITIGLLALVTWTSGWQHAGFEPWAGGVRDWGTPWYERLLYPLLLSCPAFWIAASKYSESNRIRREIAKRDTRSIFVIILIVLSLAGGLIVLSVAGAAILRGAQASGGSVGVGRNTIWVETVRRGDMPLLVHGRGALTTNNTAHLRLPLSILKDVKPGQTVSIRFNVPTEQWATGKVARTSLGVTEGTVAVRITSALPSGVHPGVGVDGIAVDVLKSVLWVGRPAQCQPNSTCTLFKLEQNGKQAVRVKVELGRQFYNSTLEIRSGLAPGDNVILSDMAVFKRYDRLRLE